MTDELTVEQIIEALTASRKRVSQADLLCKGLCGVYSSVPPGDERMAHILYLREHGWTLAAIGWLYGISTERVRQLVTPKPSSPPKPPKPPKPDWTGMLSTKQVAEVWGCTVNDIHNMRRSGKCPVDPERVGRSFMWSEALVRAVNPPASLRWSDRRRRTIELLLQPGGPLGQRRSQ